MPSIVELAPAYVWDCESCGRENLQRAISVRLDPDDPADAETIRRIEGLDDDEPIDRDPLFRRSMTTRPERVTCKHCGEEFKAVDSGAGECCEGDVGEGGDEVDELDDDGFDDLDDEDDE